MRDNFYGKAYYRMFSAVDCRFAKAMFQRDNLTSCWSNIIRKRLENPFKSYVQKCEEYPIYIEFVFDIRMAK
jgi:hypothetical protein